MPATAPSPASKRAYLLIPFTVLLVLHPLLIHGPSCGQDLAFHLQSWLDAAHQLRHGTLYPHWDITAAWNAGEPRFLFYPPISWMLGAILTLIFPINLCPTIFIAIALLLSGFTFHKLATEFASPNAALLAATLYLANPYMLFTAFERSALAELLAAAWIPLLLLALLRPTPANLPTALRTIRNIAIPLALLWLTNAPAAVIGSYALALIATLRVLTTLFTSTTLSSRLKAVGRSGGRGPRRAFLGSWVTKTPSSPAPPTDPAPATIRYPKASALGLPQTKGGFSPWGMPFRLALTHLASATLGLTLSALYLLPAAYERKYVQTAMALLPNMRYQDNFLFTPTTDPAHNAVNHTISLLALTLLLLTAGALLTLLTRLALTRKLIPHENSVIPSEAPNSTSLAVKNPVILSEARSAQPKDPEEFRPTQTSPPFSTDTPRLAYTLSFLTLIIAFLLTPLSTPIWQHLPNLAYLQFPWRLLTLLTPILALSVALLLDTRNNLGAPFMAWLHRDMSGPATALTLLLPLAIAVPAYRLYHQPPDPTDDPTHLAQLFTTHHGFPPTDEYTPTLADNDPLRTNNPAYWLARSPNDPAPNTTPTAAELNPTLDTDDTPIPDTETLSTPAPHHLTLNLAQPSILVLNLRDYPNWDVTGTGLDTMSIEHYPEPPRNDGLIALQLPRGQRTINITWHRTPDQTLGLILSALSLIVLALTFRRRSSPARSSNPRRPRRTPARVT